MAFQNTSSDPDANLKFLDLSLSFDVLRQNNVSSPRLSHSSLASFPSARSGIDLMPGSVVLDVTETKSFRADQQSPRISLTLDDGPWPDDDPRKSFTKEGAPRKSWSVNIPQRKSYIASHDASPRGSWAVEGDARIREELALTSEPTPLTRFLPCSRSNSTKVGPAETLAPGLRLLNTLPVTIKFEDIVYKAILRQNVTWWDVKGWGRKLTRQTSVQEKIIILHGVTGVVHPGEIMGMLGPSGSGKTTLLQILAGRLEQTGGTISYNGIPYVKSMSRRTGLVTQNDVLYPHLTVKETLLCAALLRLPGTFTREEKRHRAVEVIIELGLPKCQNTIVGNAAVRGVSGGERRRVSIGHEMLTDPSLLLLDEPTSGLDSTTALNIMTTLRRLAQGGKTIITSIHQPSSIIYHKFDKLIVMSDGFPVFYGKGSGALDYFGSIGFQPTFATNPADFLLDLANGVTYKLDQMEEDIWSPSTVVERAKEQAQEQSLVKRTLREGYARHLSEESKLEMTELKPITDEEINDTKGKRDWATTWCEQVAVLTVRNLKERRHESLGGLRIAEAVVIAIICGLIWWQSSNTRIQDKIGLMFFTSTVWGFFPLFNAIFTFPLERRMIKKERGSGMYRLSAYFMAQTVCDIPMELILPTVYIILVYWMGGLKANATAFLLSWLVLLYTVLVAQGLGLAIGAVCTDLKSAVTLASVMLLTSLLTGGFYTQKTSAIVAWIKYISFPYYGFKLALIAQFGPDETYPCQGSPTGECRVADHSSIRHIGLTHPARPALALLALLITFRLITYVALRRTKD